MTESGTHPRRRWSIAVVVALVVAALIGGLVYLVLPGEEPSPAKNTADRRTPAPSGKPEEQQRIRGVVYDISAEQNPAGSAPPVRYDPDQVRRELGIIANDLHANAIRLTGSDPWQLIEAAKIALDEGLQVWLTPPYPDRDERATTARLVKLAAEAERLRRRGPGVVFVVGVEMSLSMKGILRYDGDLFDYLETPAFEKAITSGQLSKRLNAALGRITGAVRAVFKGKLTYASTMFEQVDWRRFDIAGADLYREAKTKAILPGMIRNYLSHGKPVVATEFGSTTYKNADKIPFDKAVDNAWKATRVVGGLVRDEDLQARELTELVRLFDKQGLAGGFVFTFKEPTMPHDPQNPERDLDMASFSLVKTYARDRRPTGSATFEGVPWEPKKAFWAVAEAFDQ